MPKKFRYAPVGSLVRDGFWRHHFRVLPHNGDGTITIRWVDGESAGQAPTHRTPFDHRLDRIVAEAQS